MNNFNTNTVDVNSLKILLDEADIFFTPKLSEQINLTEYAKKIITNGFTAEFWYNSTLQGCIAGYINDTETLNAYISFVYVNKNHRRSGVAQKLLQLFIEEAKKQNFKNIFLKCNKNNTAALSFYKKNDFQIASSYSELKYLLKKEI